METYARDVYHFVDALGGEGSIMVGWSMGSIVLWNYIMQFGAGQARAMVFVGQSASDLTTASYPHGIMDKREFHQWMTDLQGDRRRLVESNMKLMVKQPPTEQELQWMTEDYLRCPAHIATVAFYHQTAADSFPAFQRIDFPTQVYFGADPKMYTLEQGEYLAGRIRDCELVVFEGSGHVPMWEEPDRFNRELIAFGQRVFH
jgi:pimeloyl-ACP methyl ester carboxylesterase